MEQWLSKFINKVSFTHFLTLVLFVSSASLQSESLPPKEVVKLEEIRTKLSNDLFIKDNNLPVAIINKTTDEIRIEELVVLEGGKSIDHDKDRLTYQWFFISKPSNSDAELSKNGDENASFEPDVVGVYQIGLVVFDGKIYSGVDIIEITAKK